MLIQRLSVQKTWKINLNTIFCKMPRAAIFFLLERWHLIGIGIYSEEAMQHIQGDHRFQKQNSLSFSWDFQGISKFLPEQLKRGKFDGMHFCWQSCHIVSFPLSFPGFFHKNSDFPEFSLKFWQFFRLPEFSRFFMFSRFVAILI